MIVSISLNAEGRNCYFRLEKKNIKKGMTKNCKMYEQYGEGA